MKKFLLSLCAGLLVQLSAWSQITLERCLQLADANYPLIKKYGLVDKTRELGLSDINKGWLPQVGLYGQATLQNAVPEFPDALTDIMSKLGQDFDGMGKFQYRAGVEVSQNIWDGGTSKSRREIERATSTVSAASLDVQMYAMHGKVQDLFFGILLLDEQMAQTRSTMELLEANRSRMEAMLANGTAMQSDVDAIEAQLLTMGQRLVEAQNAAEGYRRVLELYIGESLDGKRLEMPAADMPGDMTPDRPELYLLEARRLMNNARLGAVDATVMPRVGLFAQAYYGYPGFNNFEGMRNRDLSFNALVGVRLSWDVGSLYFKKNSKSRIALDNADIEAERDLFLFNTDVQTASRRSSINGLRQVIKDDGRIVTLRGRVRKAAESQLANGVIDTTGLLDKITDENQARLNARYHEIQLLQNIYRLKYTLNR